MSKEKKNYPVATLPIGTARYPHLDKPDTEGMYPSGKYDITLVYDKDFLRANAGALKAACEQAAIMEWGTKDGVAMPWRDGDKQLKQDGTAKEDLVGKYTIKAKTKFLPRQLGPDGETELLPEDGVRHGDDARAEVKLFPCVTNGKRQITCQLERVQLAKRNTSAAGGGKMPPIEAAQEPQPVPADDFDGAAADEEPPF